MHNCISNVINLSFHGLEQYIFVFIFLTIGALNLNVHNIDFLILKNENLLS